MKGENPVYQAELPMVGKARLHVEGHRSSLKRCVISGEFSDVASIARPYDWSERNGVLSQ